MPPSSPVSAAVRSMNRAALERALGRKGATIPPGAMVDAGRLAWLQGLRVLVRRGGDVNASARHYRPLHALIQEKPHEGGSSTPKRVACLEWMLAHGADPDLPGAWPLARAPIVAAFQGVAAYLRVLRKGRGKPDIYVAAAVGDAARVRVLLGDDASLAAARDGGVLTALHCAAGSRMGGSSPRTKAGLLESARHLLDAGADANAVARSWGHDVGAGYFAIRSGQRELLELLLDRGLDPTSSVSPAAWEARGDILDLLIARGADVDRAVESGRPILNELIRWGQFRQARLLLARGASPNVADDGGWTAMHQAASRGNQAMFDDLVAAGGDLAVRDRAGLTPPAVARYKKRLKPVTNVPKSQPV